MAIATLSYRRMRKRIRPAASVLRLVPFIIGAGLLDLDSITHFLNDGCFEANILAVSGAQLPFALSGI